MCVVDILYVYCLCFFFFSSRRRHTRWTGDWSSDVCSSDLAMTREYCLKNKLALPYAPAGSVIGNGDEAAAQNGAETKPATETAEEASHSVETPAGGNGSSVGSVPMVLFRSEERRVGKECRSRRWP